MTSKYIAKVLELREANPTWSVPRLAKEVGANSRSLYRLLERHDCATTERDVVPEGYLLRGTSTYVDRNGAVAGQWIKTAIDPDQESAMVEAACRAAVEKLPHLPVIPGPESFLADLCTVYTITDAHVGMLAWGRESGEPWDLKIAEEVLIEAFSRMVLASPASEVALINQLGDFLHFDSLKPVTPEHGHVLDADSRYQKMVEIAVKILRRVIEIALMRHNRVIVKLMEGNHDEAGSVWLRVIFAQLFENNPRVQIDTSPLPYSIYQHGRTLLGFHHGHCTNKDNLSAIFAARWRNEWGNSNYTYIHTGHLHNEHVKEYPGCKVIQHPTLAAQDAYAARGGFFSKREATAITYHVEFGEYCRYTVIPKEF
jgi:hypothetical protein